MASGVAGQIKEEFLVCQICFEDYLNPKVLPCQHTFCKTCLENMVAKMGKLTCPNCRLACQLPRSGVEGLPTSFFVNKLRSIIGNAGTNYRREDEPVTTSSYSLDYRGESVPVACGRESPSLPTANRAHGVVSAGDTAGAAAQQTEATPAGGQSAQNTRSRQAHSGGDMAGAAEQQTEATPAGGQSAQNTRSRQAHSAGNTAGAAAQQTEATPAGGRSAQNTRSRQAHSGGDTAGATAQQTGATPAGGQSARNTRSRQAHVPDVHGTSHTSRPVDQQRNDKGPNESQINVKAGKDEHRTVSSTTNVGSDPLGATTPPAPPHGTHNKQQHPTTSRESMPGQRYSHFDPTILCLPLLSEEEGFKLAKCLKENVEKSTQGRTVRVVQLYVDGNERSRYDYPEGGNAFPIPHNIQRAIDDDVKGEKGAVVIVVFDDGVFRGVGWEFLPIPSDPIGKLSQQLREKVERDKEGRVVKVIQIFVDGKIANRYDYPESADVFHIPDYIRPRIKGKGFEAVVIFDDGPCKDPRKEELGSRCLNLDDLIYELP
ncbi:uncharacterized protein LOC144918062 isoform X1 [Branchiostoma floridae x Branchiostoma belcheri]